MNSIDLTKIEKLRGKISGAGLDAMLVCPSQELRFLTGFSPMMCERFQGLFIPAEGAPFYICNRLYADEIEEQYGDSFKVYSWFDGEDMSAAVYAALTETGLTGSKMGVNSTAQSFNTIPIGRVCGIEFEPGLAVLEEARIIKTLEEQANLKRAAEIADESLSDVLTFIKPGQTEGMIFDYFCERMVARGGTEPWAIVASGHNSSYPHYMGTERVIEAQDVIVLDFGCVYKGMFSDTTRTVFVGGVTERQRAVYEIVRRAQEAGESAAVDGAYIPEVDAAARDIIALEGYGEFFYTRLGHGIGYMIHEAPDIKRSNARCLEAGMAFSIEPGIYLPGDFGVRIENIVLVTPGGHEVLNRTSRELIII